MPTSAFYNQTPDIAPTYPAKLVFALLISSVCYLAVLSLINARGIHVSAALVTLVEGLIYVVCLGVLYKHMPLSTLALSFMVSAWIVFTWLIRQSPDIKSLRDLIIPILFISLGRYVADVRFADQILKRIVYVVLAVGLFEVLFIDAYSNIFNTFSFYVILGHASESAAMFTGQMLTLNGFRPEGIGRTLLPFLFGPHRASSVLLEPVSLGNFAVVVLAWTLSKPWESIRAAPFLAISVVVLIILCDSRFGLVVGGALIALRLMPLGFIRKVMPTMPFLTLGLIMLVALLMPGNGDNIVGRTTFSGNHLMNMDIATIFGLNGQMSGYGDVGYAYVMSRFGAPLAIVLIFTIFLTQMPDERGMRFRGLIVFYLFANLAISGTSIFALKTGGLLWFLFGVLSAAPSTASRSLQESKA